MKANHSPIYDPDLQAEYCATALRQWLENAKTMRRLLSDNPSPKTLGTVRQMLRELQWSGEGQLAELEEVLREVTQARHGRVIKRERANK